MKSAILAAGIAACGLFASAAHAQAFTALYNYNGLAGNEAGKSITTQPTGATFSDITRGSGITATAGGNSLNSNGFTTGTSVDLNDYYGFTITPATGKTVSLSSLVFEFQRSGTGPTQFAVRTSADGFASDIYTTSETTGTTGLNRNVDLTGVTGLQNVTTATTIRIYGYAAGATGGTFRLNSQSANTGTSIAGVVNNVAVVPEAGTLALIAPALGVIGAVVVRRRKNA